MIRRETKCPDGSRGWFLISQVQHAQLSGDFAQQWRIEPAPDLAPVWDEVIGAIIRHDDGWSTWEENPKLDPQAGRPLSFTEMPLADSLEIWRRSIEIAAEIGPLAASMVSGHFLNLLMYSAAWEDAGKTGQAARGWAAEFERRRDQWLTEWKVREPSVHTQQLATTALGFLQMLDALSLYFCCNEPAVPHQAIIAGRTVAEFKPRTADDFSVEPWPFEKTPVRFGAKGKLVPQGHYESGAQLLARGQDTVVTWCLSLNPL